MTFKESLIQYIFNVLLGFDQFVNTWFMGFPDETLSARTYRLRNRNSFWKFTHLLINALLFFQKEHCKMAYIAELERKQSPMEERL